MRAFNKKKKPKHETKTKILKGKICGRVKTSVFSKSSKPESIRIPFFPMHDFIERYNLKFLH